MLCRAVPPRRRSARAEGNGGRKMGPLVTAMSAEASDMSSWLLMGMPGLAYLSGIASPGWMAIGLALGTWLNWLIVARRLRRIRHLRAAARLPDLARRLRCRRPGHPGSLGGDRSRVRGGEVKRKIRNEPLQKTQRLILCPENQFITIRRNSQNGTVSPQQKKKK